MSDLTVTELRDQCVCAPGQRTGVRPVQLRASTNLEVWAASPLTRGYDFGSHNHVLVREGTTFTFPPRAVSEYTDGGPPHFHVRPRNSVPHSLSAHPWQEVPLTRCECRCDEAGALDGR